MQTFTVDIKGLAEIERRLRELPEKVRRKHVRKSLKDATEIVRSDAQRRAPREDMTMDMWDYIYGVDTGPHLKDNITSKVTVGANGASGKVGIDYKKVHHGHLVEFGTKPHRIGKFSHPGAKKHPFMRPAFDARGDEAVEVITTQLRDAVEKEAQYGR